MASKLKTVIVVYTATKLSQKEANNLKHYAFNTSDNLKVGDMISSKDYNTPMQIIKVLTKAYNFFNLSNGELSDNYTSTAQRSIRKFIIRNDDDEAVVYGKKIN